MKNRHRLTGLAILSSLAVLVAGPGWGVEPRRAAEPARFALRLADKLCGPLKSATGGIAAADVIHEPMGPDGVVKKRIGNITFEDITIQLGVNVCRELFEWIKETLALRVTRKNGAIMALDVQNNEVWRIEFSNALITEIGFPAFDTASREAVYLTLKLSPESTRRRRGAAKVAFGQASARKVGPPSNFKLEIGDLQTASVTRIDAFTVRLAPVSRGVGESRGFQRDQVKLEVPNLTFYLPERDAESFYLWHEDFVVRGNNHDGMEKRGSLIWLSEDHQTELGRLNLQGVGIVRLSPVETPGGSQGIQRVRVDVYAEQMEFMITVK